MYLGPISKPPSEDEARVLSQSDLIILDPYEEGVLDALSESENPRSPRVVARYDLRSHVPVDLQNEKGSKSTGSAAAAFVKSFFQAVGYSIKRPGEGSPFSAILLAGWDGTASFPLLNGIAKALGQLGMEVYLEVTPPNFLHDVKHLDLSPFDGMAVRNATILADGERRDYFGMEKMLSTVKAFVSQSCLRDFTVMMWETVDDGAEISLATMRRTFGWCSYHDAIVWVNPAMAMIDASQNLRVEEPLGAFRWLKEPKVMEYHEMYRNARLVNTPPPNTYISAILTVLAIIEADLSPGRLSSACRNGSVSKQHRFETEIGNPTRRDVDHHHHHPSKSKGRAGD